MSDTIETRLAKLERDIAVLKSRTDRDRSHWIAEITGSCKDDPSSRLRAARELDGALESQGGRLGASAGPSCTGLFRLSTRTAAPCPPC